MNANELMCGDLILVDGRPTRIYGIMERMGRVYDTMTNDISLKRCEPIPITDEILEKNGFKPQGTGWILEDSIGERIFNLCRISNAYCLLTAGMTLAFQSVHELQHLFRLAGMKREIKL